MSDNKIRYAIVGAGWISQAALMPGVEHTGNSVMTALVTGDVQKGQELGKLYNIPHIVDYKGYNALLASGKIDAVYIGLPNWMHEEYTVPALEAGIHVLLEKPVETSLAKSEAILKAASRSKAKLMVAYRLHFEPATLQAIKLAREGTLGDLRVFAASMSQPLDPSNHRANHGFWAGPVADMGPYPINAARNLFGDEPTEVHAVGSRKTGSSFDFDDTVAVTLRFPGERIAQFTVSYTATGVNSYRITGDKGDLYVSPGFLFDVPLVHHLTLNGEESTVPYPQTDQFGGELQYFSDCILNNRDPEPDGEEGHADMRVLDAIERALATRKPQHLEAFKRGKRPQYSQVVTLSPVKPPKLINAKAPAA